MMGDDDDTTYPYTASNARITSPALSCWKAGQNRTVAKIDSYKRVTPNNDAQLAAAVALNPVAVMIDGPSKRVFVFAVCAFIF